MSQVRVSWRQDVARNARIFARDGKLEAFQFYSDELPESQREFAKEKFEHYALMSRRDAETAPVQSLACCSAKTMSIDEFAIVIKTKVPKELHDYAVKIFKHHQLVVLTKRHKYQLPKSRSALPSSVSDAEKESLISLGKGRVVKDKKTGSYVREGTLSLDFVLSNVGKCILTTFGAVANCGSWRIKSLAEHGVACAHCGISGTMFAVERHLHPGIKRCHLNLYHVSDSGEEMLMTVDHVVPVSKGGSSDLSNLQTLCRKCNERKGNMAEEKAIEIAYAENRLKKTA